MLKKVKRNIILLLATAILLYLVLAVYSDINAVKNSLRQFSFSFLPLLLFLSLMNIFTRYLKWDYYLQTLDVDLNKKFSAAIYSSSLVMLVTPGALGELFKSYLVKKASGESISKTAPIVFAERMTDFISLVIFSFFGAVFFDHSKVLIVVTGLILISIVILLTNKYLTIRTIRYLSNFRLMHKYLTQINTVYDSFHKIFSGVPLIMMTILTMISWLLEFFTVYLVFTAMDINVDFFWVSFIYAFSVLFGSITSLPGGIGVTDGSLIYFITQRNLQQNQAVALIIVIRLITLWFTVFIGSIGLIWVKNILYNPEEETEQNMIND